MQSQLSIHSQGLLSSTGFRFFPEKVVPQNPNYPQIKTMKTKSHILPAAAAAAAAKSLQLSHKKTQRKLDAYC